MDKEYVSWWKMKTTLLSFYIEWTFFNNEWTFFFLTKKTRISNQDKQANLQTFPLLEWT